MQPVAQALVETTERIAARLPLPKVRALHMPEAVSPAGRDAEFCALELEDGAIGFSYVWLGDTLQRMRGDAVSLGAVGAGRDPREVARGYRSTDAGLRALGMAAINAISQHLFARAGWVPAEAGDSLGRLAAGPGDHVGMVGLFPPLVGRITGAGARLTVLELRTDLAGERDGYRVTLDPGELADCDRVLSTSTVLLNDTLDAVLHACRNARTFAMIGPTAGCVPDPLFERGVDTVGGTRVIDRDGFVAAFRSGAPWGSFTRKYTIRRDGYPGIEALLQRAGN